MQDSLGNTFSGATRRQYLLNVPLRIGGQTTDGTNATSLRIRNEDLFVRSTFLEIRTATEISPSQITITMGTKTGTGEKTGGIQGGTLHLQSTHTLRCNLGIYGSLILGTAALTFNNNGTNEQEFGGSLVVCQGANSLVLGTAATGPFRFYNSVAASATTGTMITSAFIDDMANALLCASGCANFYRSSAALRRFRKTTLSGTCTGADFRFDVGAGDNELTEIDWSDSVGVPRINTANTDPDEAVAEWHFYDTKVVDPNGNALSGIPVLVVSSVQGEIIDTQTLADGNIVYTTGGGFPTPLANTVRVRDHYSADGTLTNVIVRDRTFTVTVNGYGGAFAPNLNHATVKYTFEFPGRDRTATGFAVDGGTFKRTLDVIHLPFGTPSSQPIWEPCVVLTP